MKAYWERERKKKAEKEKRVWWRATVSESTFANHLWSGASCAAQLQWQAETVVFPHFPSKAKKSLVPYYWKEESGLEDIPTSRAPAPGVTAALQTLGIDKQRPSIEATSYGLKYRIFSISGYDQGKVWVKTQEAKS